MIQPLSPSGIENVIEMRSLCHFWIFFFMIRKLNIKCMFVISGLVLACWYVCQKNYQLTRFLATCTFALSEHQKYQVPQRISPKREIHISPPPKPIPISHLPSRGKRPMFHGLNSAASEPFNKLSQICQN